METLTTPASAVGAGSLDRSSPMPLWAQLLASLKRRMAAGEFADVFPTEHALRREYDVSRHTVRAALAQLRADGTVVAKRGRGSHVTVEPTVVQPLGALYSLFRSVEATGLEQRSIVRRLDERADAVMSARLGLDGSVPLIHLERVRLAGEQPLAIDRVWLPADLARPLLDADFAHTSLYAELDRRCNLRITSGDERVTAVMPRPEEQALLESSQTNPAVLRIERIGYALGQPVELRITLVRGDRFALSSSWSPTSTFDSGTFPAQIARL